MPTYTHEILAKDYLLIVADRKLAKHRTNRIRTYLLEQKQSTNGLNEETQILS